MTQAFFNVYQQLTSVRLVAPINVAGTYFNGQLNNGIGATLTANSVGALIIDAVKVNVGDRVLLVSQTGGISNGIYVVNSAGSFASLWQLERATDFQSIEQIKLGQYVSVNAGATQAGSMFVIIEPLPSYVGGGTFNFMSVVDTGGVTGPYLLKAANLSDVANSTTGIENLGLGQPSLLVLDDANFAAGGGTYILTNPPPTIISMSTAVDDRILQLPPQNQPNSLQDAASIQLINFGPHPILINNAGGGLVKTIEPDGQYQAFPNDRTTVDGAWEFLGEVRSVNGLTGAITVGGGGSPPQIVYVVNTGSDITGDGTIGKPYATLSHALSVITPSSSTPYCIQMVGVFTETNLALKPWVSIQGNDSSSLTVTGSVTLDASWSTGGELTLNHFFSIAWPASVTLDFTGSPTSVFTFSNCFQSGNTTLNIIGDPTSGAILLLENLINFSSEWVYNITNCYGAINGGDCGNITINHTSETAGANFTVSNETIIGNFLLNDTTAAGMEFFHNNCTLIGSCTYQSNGTGSVNVVSKAQTYFSSQPVIDNGTSGGQVNFIYDVLGALPTLLNGATLLLSSDSDVINANQYFTPANYTPTAGAWPASSVVGNLKGIDLALAGITGGGTENIVWVGMNGSDVTGDGSFQKPYATGSHAMSQITTNSASNTFTLQYGTGVYSDTGFAVKPFVIVDGGGAQLTCSTPITLDASWSTGGKGAIQNFNQSSFPAGINLNFSAVSGLSWFTIQNITSATNDTFGIIGSSTIATQFVANNIYGFAFNPSLNIQNCYGEVIDSQPLNVYIDNNDGNNRSFSVIGSVISNVCNASSENGQLVLFLSNSQFNSGCTFSNTAPGRLTIINTSTFISPYTLNGDSNLQWNTIAQPVPATLIGGTGGHLAGIDAVLGGGGGGDTLQDVYNNGTPGAQGTITLANTNLSPIATFNSYAGGNQEHFVALNSQTSSYQLWGYGFRSTNSITSYIDYAHAFANVVSNTAGSECGSLGLYVNSFGTLTNAFLVDGFNQDITSTYPMHVANGTQTYESLDLLTGDVTYTGQLIGYDVVSDDTAMHTITIPTGYHSTNADDTFSIQTRGSFQVTLAPSGGTTINGSSSNIIVPLNTLATLRLVDPIGNGWLLTQESLGANGAYSPFLTSVSNIGSLSLDRAFCIVPYNGSTNCGLAVVAFTGVPSAQSFEIGISCPVITNFVTNDKAIFMGGSATNTPNVNDGTLYDAKSVSSSSQVNIPGQVPVGGIGLTYDFNVSFIFQIQ